MQPTSDPKARPSDRTPVRRAALPTLAALALSTFISLGAATISPPPAGAEHPAAALGPVRAPAVRVSFDTAPNTAGPIARRRPPYDAPLDVPRPPLIAARAPDGIASPVAAPAVPPPAESGVLAAAPAAPSTPAPPPLAAAPAPPSTPTPAPPSSAAPTATPQPTPQPTPVPAIDIAPPAPPAPRAEAVLSTREAGFLEAMNRERVAAGLPAMEAKLVLIDVARARSKDMIAKGYFAHFRPGSQSAYALLSAAGVRFGAGGENLAKVGGDAERSVEVAITALMRSASHRENILNARYRYAGVGAATGASGITIFTTIFTDR